MDTPYEKLLESSPDAEVKFIIVGGVAVALNGFVRQRRRDRGKHYVDLVGATKTTRIDDVDVRDLNAEALIALKSDSPRDQDRIDVSALRSLLDRNNP